MCVHNYLRERIIVARRGRMDAANVALTESDGSFGQLSAFTCTELSEAPLLSLRTWRICHRWCCQVCLDHGRIVLAIMAGATMESETGNGVAFAGAAGP
eukprot:4964074-Amphidinium_carterae.1